MSSRRTAVETPAVNRRAAVEIQRRADQLKATLPALDLDFQIATIGVITEMQDDPIPAIRDVLHGLLEPAARLLASDQVRVALLGKNGFPAQPGVVLPVNGEMIMEKLIRYIPEAVRPDGLDMTSITEAARSISQPIISAIREG